MVFGDIGANNLVFHFAVFEEEQEGNRAHAVLHRELAGVIDINFANFCLTRQLIGELINDWADRFARTAPFGPEIDKNRGGGFDDFALEVSISELKCHAQNMDVLLQNVKSRSEKNPNGSLRMI